MTSVWDKPSGQTAAEFNRSAHGEALPRTAPPPAEAARSNEEEIVRKGHNAQMHLRPDGVRQTDALNEATGHQQAVAELDRDIKERFAKMQGQLELKRVAEQKFANNKEINVELSNDKDRSV